MPPTSQHDPSHQVRESVLGTEHVLVAKTIVNRANVCLPPPPSGQPRRKLMVSLVKCHTNATRIGWYLWEIDLRFAPVLGTKHVLVAKTIVNRANVNPKPETRNPKPETRDPKPETRNPKRGEPGTRVRLLPFPTPCANPPQLLIDLTPLIVHYNPSIVDYRTPKTRHPGP